MKKSLISRSETGGDDRDAVDESEEDAFVWRPAHIYEKFAPDDADANIKSAHDKHENPQPPHIDDKPLDDSTGDGRDKDSSIDKQRGKTSDDSQKGEVVHLLAENEASLRDFEAGDHDDEDHEVSDRSESNAADNSEGGVDSNLSGDEQKEEESVDSGAEEESVHSGAEEEADDNAAEEVDPALVKDRHSAVDSEDIDDNLSVDEQKKEESNEKTSSIDADAGFEEAGVDGDLAKPIPDAGLGTSFDGTDLGKANVGESRNSLSKFGKADLAAEKDDSSNSDDSGRRGKLLRDDRADIPSLDISDHREPGGPDDLDRKPLQGGDNLWDWDKEPDQKDDTPEASDGLPVVDKRIAVTMRRLSSMDNVELQIHPRSTFMTGHESENTFGDGFSRSQSQGHEDSNGSSHSEDVDTLDDADEAKKHGSMNTFADGYFGSSSESESSSSRSDDKEDLSEVAMEHKNSEHILGADNITPNWLYEMASSESTIDIYAAVQTEPRILGESQELISEDSKFLLGSDEFSKKDVTKRERFRRPKNAFVDSDLSDPDGSDDSDSMFRYTSNEYARHATFSNRDASDEKPMKPRRNASIMGDIGGNTNDILVLPVEKVDPDTLPSIPSRRSSVGVEIPYHQRLTPDGPRVNSPVTCGAVNKSTTYTKSSKKYSRANSSDSESYNTKETSFVGGMKDEACNDITCEAVEIESAPVDVGDSAGESEADGRIHNLSVGEQKKEPPGVGEPKRTDPSPVSPKNSSIDSGVDDIEDRSMFNDRNGEALKPEGTKAAPNGDKDSVDDYQVNSTSKNSLASEQKGDAIDGSRSDEIDPATADVKDSDDDSDVEDMEDYSPFNENKGKASEESKTGDDSETEHQKDAAGCSVTPLSEEEDVKEIKSFEKKQPPKSSGFFSSFFGVGKKGTSDKESGSRGLVVKKPQAMEKVAAVHPSDPNETSASNDGENTACIVADFKQPISDSESAESGSMDSSSEDSSSVGEQKEKALVDRELEKMLSASVCKHDSVVDSGAQKIVANSLVGEHKVKAPGDSELDAMAHVPISDKNSFTSSRVENTSSVSGQKEEVPDISQPEELDSVPVSHINFVADSDPDVNTSIGKQKNDGPNHNKPAKVDLSPVAKGEANVTESKSSQENPPEKSRSLFSSFFGISKKHPCDHDKGEITLDAKKPPSLDKKVFPMDTKNSIENSDPNNIISVGERKGENPGDSGTLGMYPSVDNKDPVDNSESDDNLSRCKQKKKGLKDSESNEIIHSSVNNENSVGDSEPQDNSSVGEPNVEEPEYSESKEIDGKQNGQASADARSVKIDSADVINVTERKSSTKGNPGKSSGFFSSLFGISKKQPSDTENGSKPLAAKGLGDEKETVGPMVPINHQNSDEAEDNEPVRESKEPMECTQDDDGNSMDPGKEETKDPMKSTKDEDDGKEHSGRNEEHSGASSDNDTDDNDFSEDAGSYLSTDRPAAIAGLLGYEENGSPVGSKNAVSDSESCTIDDDSSADGSKEEVRAYSRPGEREPASLDAKDYADYSEADDNIHNSSVGKQKKEASDVRKPHEIDTVLVTEKDSVVDSEVDITDDNSMFSDRNGETSKSEESDSAPNNDRDSVDDYMLKDIDGNSSVYEQHGEASDSNSKSDDVATVDGNYAVDDSEAERQQGVAGCWETPPAVEENFEDDKGWSVTSLAAEKNFKDDKEFRAIPPAMEENFKDDKTSEKIPPPKSSGFFSSFFGIVEEDSSDHKHDSKAGPQGTEKDVGSCSPDRDHADSTKSGPVGSSSEDYSSRSKSGIQEFYKHEASKEGKPETIKPAPVANKESLDNFEEDGNGDISSVREEKEKESDKTEPQVTSREASDIECKSSSNEQNQESFDSSSHEKVDPTSVCRKDSVHGPTMIQLKVVTSGSGTNALVNGNEAESKSSKEIIPVASLGIFSSFFCTVKKNSSDSKKNCETGKGLQDTEKDAVAHLSDGVNTVVARETHKRAVQLQPVKVGEEDEVMKEISDLTPQMGSGNSVDSNKIVATLGPPLSYADHAESGPIGSSSHDDSSCSNSEIQESGTDKASDDNKQEEMKPAPIDSKDSFNNFEEDNNCIISSIGGEKENEFDDSDSEAINCAPVSVAKSEADEIGNISLVNEQKRENFDGIEPEETDPIVVHFKDSVDDPSVEQVEENVTESNSSEKKSQVKPSGLFSSFFGLGKEHSADYENGSKALAAKGPHSTDKEAIAKSPNHNDMVVGESPEVILKMDSSSDPAIIVSVEGDDTNDALSGILDDEIEPKSVKGVISGDSEYGFLLEGAYTWYRTIPIFHIGDVHDGDLFNIDELEEGMQPELMELCDVVEVKETLDEETQHFSPTNHEDPCFSADFNDNVVLMEAPKIEEYDYTKEEELDDWKGEGNASTNYQDKSHDTPADRHNTSSEKDLDDPMASTNDQDDDYNTPSGRDYDLETEPDDPMISTNDQDDHYGDPTCQDNYDLENPPDEPIISTKAQDDDCNDPTVVEDEVPEKESGDAIVPTKDQTDDDDPSDGEDDDQENETEGPMVSTKDQEAVDKEPSDGDYGDIEKETFNPTEPTKIHQNGIDGEDDDEGIETEGSKVSTKDQEGGDEDFTDSDHDDLEKETFNPTVSTKDQQNGDNDPAVVEDEVPEKESGDAIVITKDQTDDDNPSDGEDDDQETETECPMVSTKDQEAVDKEPSHRDNGVIEKETSNPTEPTKSQQNGIDGEDHDEENETECPNVSTKDQEGGDKDPTDGNHADLEKETFNPTVSAKDQQNGDNDFMNEEDDNLEKVTDNLMESLNEDDADEGHTNGEEDDNEVSTDDDDDGSSDAGSYSSTDFDDDYEDQIAAIVGLLGDGFPQNSREDESADLGDNSNNSDDSSDVDEAKLASITGILGGSEGKWKEEPCKSNYSTLVHVEQPENPVTAVILNERGEISDIVIDDLNSNETNGQDANLMAYPHANEKNILPQDVDAGAQLGEIPEKHEKQEEESLEEEDDQDSSSDSESEQGENVGTVNVKEAPLLRLENVTSMTRSQIPVNHMQKKKASGGWADSFLTTLKGLAVDGQGLSGSKHGPPGAGQPAPAVPIAAPLSESVATAQSGTKDPKSPERKKGKKEKEPKKKETKETLLGSHFKKNARNVSRYGDDVSIGTLNLRKKTSSDDKTQQVIISTSRHDLEDVPLPLEKGTHPWKKEGKAHKAWDITKASTCVVHAMLEATEQSQSIMDAKTFEMEYLKKDMLSQMDESPVNVEMDQALTKEPSAVTEEKSGTNNDLALHNVLENALKQEQDKEENFEDVWDTTDADVMTAIEVEQKQRQNFRKKKERKASKKSKKKGDDGKDEEESKHKEMKRLYLFESGKKKSKKKKTSKKDKEKDDNISSEFLFAFREVFNDDSDGERDSHGDQDYHDSFKSLGSERLEGSSDEMDDPSEKRKGSHDSFAGGSFSMVKKSAQSAQSTSDEDESVYGNATVVTNRTSAHDSVSNGSDEGKSKHSKTSRRSLKSKISRSSKNLSKHHSKAKRVKLNPAAMLEAEMIRQRGAKSMSISSLKQEMSDHRGTSIALLRKEFEAKKRDKEAAAVGWNNPIVSKGINLGGCEFAADFGQHSFEVAAKKQTRSKGMSKFNGLAEGKPDPGAEGLSAHLSRWDNGAAVSNLDDLQTIAQESVSFSPGISFSFWGGGGGLSSYNSSELASGGQSGGLSGDVSFQDTDSGNTVDLLGSLPIFLSLDGKDSKPDEVVPSLGGFADFQLSTISEAGGDDEENERGLLSGDGGLDDEKPSRKESRRFTLKAPKIRLGGVKKRFFSKKRNGSLSSANDWGDDDCSNNSSLLG